MSPIIIDPDGQARLGALEAEVAAGTTTPGAAARSLLAAFFGGTKG